VKKLIMTNRYLLQSSETPHHWVCTDTEIGIVCIFQNRKFNDTQKFTFLEDIKPDALALAKATHEMGDWLRENHYNKIF